MNSQERSSSSLSREVKRGRNHNKVMVRAPDGHAELSPEPRFRRPTDPPANIHKMLSKAYAVAKFEFLIASYEGAVNLVKEVITKGLHLHRRKGTRHKEAKRRTKLPCCLQLEGQTSHRRVILRPVKISRLHPSELIQL